MPRISRSTALAALAAVSLAFASSAQAQFFKDPELEAIHVGQRFSELEKTGTARVAARADDAQAVLALAIVAMRGGPGVDDATRRKSSIGHSEACLQRQPDAAACHYALGIVLGVQAISEGMLKAAASAGRVKDSLTQAMLLDARWYPARSALIEFYLVAPAMLGGSTSKARELARAAPSAEQVRALEARLPIDDDKFEAALQALAQVRPGSDTALAEDVAGWIYAAGIGLINAGQAERSGAAFERVVRERPDDPSGLWGLARVNAESGAHAEAVKLFGRVSALSGSERFPVDYRSGISLQALGQKELARAAFGRFIKAGKGSGKALDDARARLSTLSS